MALYSLKSVQKIPASLADVWDVFSNPANLHRITPEAMKFRTISPYEGDKLFAGQVIEYRLQPLFGIPVFWKTIITELDEGKYFVDEQRKGPYHYWRHEHHFTEIDGGVEMKDIVRYRNPFWVIGDIANRLLVRRKLRQIFEYRFHKVEEIFGPWPGGQTAVIELG